MMSSSRPPPAGLDSLCQAWSGSSGARGDDGTDRAPILRYTRRRFCSDHPLALGLVGKGVVSLSARGLPPARFLAGPGPFSPLVSSVLRLLSRRTATESLAEWLINFNNKLNGFAFVPRKPPTGRGIF